MYQGREGRFNSANLGYIKERERDSEERERKRERNKQKERKRNIILSS
jgi:hypothetical protein